MKQILTAVALATTLSVPAWAQNVAIVNGKPVPMSRVAALTAQVEKSGHPVDDATKAQIKEEVIAREIFAQEAEKQGIKASKDYQQQVELAAQTILIRELFASYQQKHPITDADAKAEYDKFAAANGGQEYHARHILVDSEDKAKAIIDEIKKGAKFEDIAKKESKDPGSGANGGDLDWATPGNFVPEFSAAMVKLNKGEMTDTPVKTQFGWHIIRVDDVRKAELPPFEQLKPQIVQQLQQRQLQAYQEELRSKAKIK